MSVHNGLSPATPRLPVLIAGVVLSAAALLLRHGPARRWLTVAAVAVLAAAAALYESWP
ncbi:hypothetical protein [Dactylosporangium sp. CS-033363]|uniref:hypothetical protein n=1 Tax=Dactylosporangium sp. CS-033363 TaxID=3239935 RepID=UPI003D8BE807